ncbi:Conserved protein containing a Zn-ribbon-like motif, possibly RNA-binding [Actinopolymorpha cephalotaxi]|uniref:Conserved protein containing a Zn-ribbon-like motif, possibly RNA-binding n=1 Tax=Actinopolymorpha cephalotaxi TaxID=504797 RepID=A0A1I3BDJ8_9ACTN|nr:CGNR zinc finger domain-containing protein [Actinopolymorpha cephalotaxi]NYH86770.1 putative RNA-binding Zn ribbon-like protein [Actinopolymorpha cephalotaxi]SFH59781.1 Conserved protein containing a Zn-ribbon-like motif, possibly RNA-binding [Actinopolymorpha cephalotaxi]
MELVVRTPGAAAKGRDRHTGARGPAAGAQEEEALLLAVLNSCPVINGVPTDELADDDKAANWLATYGRTGSEVEREVVKDVRDVLADVVRGRLDASAVSSWLDRAGVRPRPASDGIGIRWEILTDPDHEVGMRSILAWSRLQHERPGRLRACENTECQLFLIDHSKANTARWCSMAVCGNRMKARRHYERANAKRN